MTKRFGHLWKRLMVWVMLLAMVNPMIAGVYVQAAAASDATEEQGCNGTNHSYGEPSWQWSEDCSFATALFVCEGCSKSVAKAAAMAEPQVEEATCQQAGVTVYAASVEFDGETYENTRTVTVPALKHIYLNNYCRVCGAADPDMTVTDCVYLVEVDLDDASYVLLLGGVRAGRFLFAPVEDGWTIRAEDGTYLAAGELVSETEELTEEEPEPAEQPRAEAAETEEDGQTGLCLVYAEEPFVWNYEDGYFSFTAEVPAEEPAAEETTAEEEAAVETAAEEPEMVEVAHYLAWVGEEIGISTQTDTAEAAVHIETYRQSHVYGEGEEADPTCAEQGGMRFTCTYCGHRYYEDAIDPLGHDYGEWVVTSKATCLTDGEQHRECRTCGEVEYVVTVAAHSYEVTWDWAEDYSACTATIVCTVCDEDTEGHGGTVEAVVTTEVIEATYQAPGQIRHIATAEYNGQTLTDVISIESSRLIYPAPVIGVPEIPELGEKVYGYRVDSEEKLLYLDIHKDGITLDDLARMLVVPMEYDGDNVPGLQVEGTVNFRDSDIIVNGARLTVTAENLDGQAAETYTIIIIGDTNLNGRVESGDAVKMNRHYASTETLEDVALMGADTNCNGRIDSGDAVKNRIKYTSESTDGYVSALK